MAKENIDKDKKLEEIKSELEEVKKKIESQKADEEMPMVDRVTNFEMFTTDHKLNVIYDELVMARAGMNYLREKVIELQQAVGKPA